jgi:hypothetical protein
LPATCVHIWSVSRVSRQPSSGSAGQEDSDMCRL